MKNLVVALVAAASTVALAQNVRAQSIARRVDAVREGTVSMRYAAKPGVCGDGESVWTHQMPGAWSSSDRGGVCMTGPVYVSLGRAENATVSVRVRIGGRRMGSADTDLGVVPAVEAARYLIGVARGIGGRSAN